MFVTSAILIGEKSDFAAIYFTFNYDVEAIDITPN